MYLAFYALTDHYDYLSVFILLFHTTFLRKFDSEYLHNRRWSYSLVYSARHEVLSAVF